VLSQSILRALEVKNFSDFRGNLDVAEIDLEKEFQTKRIYCISSVPGDLKRGEHAHKNLKQIFFALSGEFNLTVTDGSTTESVRVKSHGIGYYLAEGYWRELSAFTPDAVCLVLASEIYDERDYIYSYDEFLRWKNNG
jgi:hypothetical protein